MTLRTIIADAAATFAAGGRRLTRLHLAALAVMVLSAGIAVADIATTHYLLAGYGDLFEEGNGFISRYALSWPLDAACIAAGFVKGLWLAGLRRPRWVGGWLVTVGFAVSVAAECYAVSDNVRLISGL